MLGLPATTQFDLNFRFLGIPVRINPFFWVMAAVLGWQTHEAIGIVIWIACVFVSILVHEFGHGLTARSLSRQRPFVVLYWMGGLCIHEQDQRSPWKRLAVILMGPAAGFLLFALVSAVGILVLGVPPFVPLLFESPRLIHQPPSWINSEAVQIAYLDLLEINFYWSVFNLLPIFPLDGGQAAQTLLTMRDPRRGARRGYILSMVTAAIVAIVLYQRTGEPLNALFVGSLGLINFQLYQATQFQSGYDRGYEDDDDWWRR